MTDTEFEVREEIFRMAEVQSLSHLQQSNIADMFVDAIRQAEQRGRETFNVTWKDVYGFPYSEFDGSWEQWYTELVKRLEKVQQAVRKEIKI